MAIDLNWMEKENIQSRLISVITDIVPIRGSI